MTQFYDDMLKAAEGIETGFEFYTKEIIPGTWEELPHGQKCTYGKWFAEDVYIFSKPFSVCAFLTMREFFPCTRNNFLRIKFKSSFNAFRGFQHIIIKLCHNITPYSLILISIGFLFPSITI